MDFLQVGPDYVDYPLVSTGQVSRLDLAGIAREEARLAEVATVTAHKAPELLAAYNDAWLSLQRTSAFLQRELGIAEDLVKQTRARVVIDEVPGIIESKGLTDAKDVREAVVEVHPDYRRARQIEHALRCVSELVKGKMKAFENAFTSVKKILGEGTYGRGGPGRGNNPALSGDSGSRPVGVVEVTEEDEYPPGFGKPRY